MSEKTNIKFAYFGGEPLGVGVLEKLATAGLFPTLIICNPDRPAGRGQILQEPALKKWAKENHIPYFQPATYKDGVARTRLEAENWDLFVVVAYNFILPDWILTMPQYGVLNVHPSLLPKLRGASPIRSAILRDEPENIGVSIMLMDQEMDHGAILKQEKLTIPKENWPLSGPVLDDTLCQLGGQLLSQTIPRWINGEITPVEQVHSDATYCHRFNKAEHELSIDPTNLPSGQEAWSSWLKINALAGIGDTFFTYQNKRVKIKQAQFAYGKLRLLRVTPEGKKEMSFLDYLSSI